MWSSVRNAQTFSGGFKSEKNDIIRFVIWFVLGGLILWLLWYMFTAIVPAAKAKWDDIVDKTKAKAEGYKLTFSKSYYNTCASTIYESIRYSDLDDNADLAEEQIKLCVKNPLDWAELISSYGLKQRYVLGFKDGEPQTLIPSLRAEFSDTRKERVNKYLSSVNVSNLL